MSPSRERSTSHGGAFQPGEDYDIRGNWQFLTTPSLRGAGPYAVPDPLATVSQISSGAAASVAAALATWPGSAALTTIGPQILSAPTIAGRGPLVIGMGLTADPVLVFGYNHRANYTVAQAGEPGLAWMLEGDYDDGSGQHKMEGYLQYLFGDGSGSYNRAFMTMWNRVTNLPVETSLSGGTTGVTIYNNTGAGAPGSQQFVLGDLVASFLPSTTTIYSTAFKLNVAAATLSAGSGADVLSSLSIEWPNVATTGATLRVGRTTNTSNSTKGVQIYKFDGSATLDAWFRPTTLGMAGFVSYIQANGGGPFGIGTTTPAAALAVNGGVHVGGDSNPGDNNLLVDGSADAVSYKVGGVAGASKTAGPVTSITIVNGLVTACT